MTFKNYSNYLMVIFVACSFAVKSQKNQILDFQFEETSQTSLNFLGSPQIQASDFKLFETNIEALKTQLNGTAQVNNKGNGSKVQITLPHPDGTMHNYQAVENNTMSRGLKLKFPEIKAYDAYGSNGAFVKWDITPQGLHAMIMIPGQSTIFIDPVIQGNTSYYMVYYKKNFSTDKIRACFFDSDLHSFENKKNGKNTSEKEFGSCELRTYRLALSASGEYTAFHGGTVAQAQAAQVTTMNRVNGVFEKDMAVSMTIVPNNNLIIYTNSGSDPFTNGNPGAMINENQTNTNNVIGSTNYDIGHVFGTNSGGLAGLGVVCSNNQKARGVTGSGAPIGDPFDIDYVAHEMGHQFACNHTFNNSCGGNRNNATAVEPGSGSTIMAYAGICPPNVQNNSDDHFSGKSLEEMGTFILNNGGSCPVTTALTNNAPIITATAGNITIPANTPFALTATATDPDANNVLTYNWEQMDNGISTQSPVATSTNGPNFRSNPSSTSPTRYFPNLVDLNAGGPFTWEVLASVSRTMDFRVTVRDNATGGACNDHEDLTVTTDENSGPFLVDYPSANGINWPGLSSQTVSWSVAGTNAAPVACSEVDILLSTDGGLTFPTVLASNVPNDGSQSVTAPNVATTDAIVMVICSNGTFFDISDNPFEISAATFDYTISSATPALSICQPLNAEYTIDIGAIGGYTDAVTLSASGVPAGASGTFSTNPVIPVGSSLFTISNTGASGPGSYTITITGTSTSGTKTTELVLVLAAGAPSTLTQTSPINGAIGVPIPTSFLWSASTDVGVSYEIDIALDAAFTNIVDQELGLASANYTSTILAVSSAYYWRVRALTGCGASAWSTAFSFVTNSCNTYSSIDIGQTTNVANFTSILEITDNGIISDLNVASLNISHPYVGDLSATLTSPSGTIVQLFDGPGIPTSNFGCNQNDMEVSFDDAAANTAADLEGTCDATPPAIGGPFQAEDALSDFNGESMTGTWTLTVFDSYVQGDDGTLDAWSIEICTEAVLCVEAELPSVANATICPEGEVTLTVDSGALNDATQWEWYTGTCGGNVAGTGTTLIVTPANTSTYYLRGIGGCVTPGACTEVTVTVEDLISPDIICPGIQTLSPGSNCEVILPDFTGQAIVSDNCDQNPLVVQTPVAGTVITNNMTVTIIARDASQNENECTFEIQIEDNIPPSVTCPQAETTCDNTLGDYTANLVVIDNCDGNPSVSQSPAAGTSLSLGTTTVSITATDVSGNVATCTFEVTIPSYSSAENVTLCNGETYTFPDGTTGTTTQAYTSLLSTADGCDSLVVTNLTVADAINTDLESSGATITAIATGVTYQWIDCDNANAAIEGETLQNFTATAQGNFAVVLTDGNCTATSECVLIDFVDLGSAGAYNIEIYPNPTSGKVTIDWDGAVNAIEITDSRGRLIKRIKECSGNTFTVNLTPYRSGVYFISIENENGQNVYDVIKQ
ncbi:MAG: M12 family metallo-peptidase [Crocinitomicaceae bacterium]